MWAECRGHADGAGRCSPRCRARRWCFLKMLSPQLPGCGSPAMMLGAGTVKTVCVHIHCSVRAPLYCEMHAVVWGAGEYKTSVVLHCEFLSVSFSHPYRCSAAVIINVGNKCPPPQAGKQRCGWRHPHLGGEMKWLSSGVQVVEESKSEQRGVYLARGRWRITLYYLS